MIVGIGVDLVDIARFERTLERTPRLLERLFSAKERALKPRSLAARYAAKEALIKALGGSDGVHWTEIEITPEASGRPCASSAPDPPACTSNPTPVASASTKAAATAFWTAASPLRSAQATARHASSACLASSSAMAMSAARTAGSEARAACSAASRLASVSPMQPSRTARAAMSARLALT